MTIPNNQFGQSFGSDAFPSVPWLKSEWSLTGWSGMTESTQGLYFLHKTCNQEVSRYSRRIQRQRNVPKKCAACTCKVAFLLTPGCCFSPFSLPPPLSITRFYILFEQPINIIESFAFQPWLNLYVRELKHRRRQRERQKKPNRFRLAKQQLRFFAHFFAVVAPLQRERA